MKKTKKVRLRLRIEDQPQDCIRTNTGLFVNVFNTNPEMICVEDIAHALSRQPRFGGHLNRHYSVAQHSVLCARKAKTLLEKRAALFHDASEAYMLDMPTPIKARLKNYKRIEKRLHKVIMDKFSIPYPYSPNIKLIDTEMFHLEYDMVAVNDDPSFVCWGPKRAKNEFLKTYKKLFIEGVLSK